MTGFSGVTDLFSAIMAVLEIQILVLKGNCKMGQLLMRLLIFDHALMADPVKR